MKRILWFCVMMVSATLFAADEPDLTVWYIPGFLRTQHMQSGAYESITNTFPGAKVEFKKWDGDNPIWGMSLANSDKSVAGFADEIAALDAGARSNLVVIGHSLGGRITCRLMAELARRKLKVRQAVMLAAAIPYDDPDLAQIGLASEEPAISICNPDDLTLRYVYSIVGGESHPPFGANGTLNPVTNLVERVTPTNITQQVDIGGVWGTTEWLKSVANHHLLFYLAYLNRILGGEVASGEIMVPQDKVNVEWGTVDAGIWWNTLEEFKGWKLEQNKVAKFCRILDPGSKRTAWGGLASMRPAFEKVKAQVKAAVAEFTVDFAKSAGPVRPALHSSGWAPRASSRAMQVDDDAIRSMNLKYARTHDWALVNAGQRVVDWHFIFPLAHLDAKDPGNYVFAPTDHLLSLARNAGLELFFRLGTSIEHTGNDVHFNACVPEDYEKTAEVFAGIVRHYNRGWADGYEWNIRYWEIWNEPDGITNMWWMPTEEGGGDKDLMRKRFIEFFVVVLKRLKSEFPELKIGGPALCWMNREYFTELLKACKEAGVAPDFISWHYYGQKPDELLGTPAGAREICDSLGFKDTELVINEYHYLVSWDGVHGENSTPEAVRKAMEGPSGLNGTDAATFYLTALSRFHATPLDQAYWYGCAHQGHWGYMDSCKRFNKPGHAARMFGRVVKDCTEVAEIVEAGPVTLFAAKGEKGVKELIVSDYRGKASVIEITVKGVPRDAKVSVRVLDQTRNDEPCEFSWSGGKLVLRHADAFSSSWLVTFE